MLEGQTILEAAIIRGRNLKKENPVIQPFSPSHHEMYRIILAAVLNLHDEIKELRKIVEEFKNIMGNHAFTSEYYDAEDLCQNNNTVIEKISSSQETIRKVNKYCKSCNKLMENVAPSQKYCDECKEKRK